VIDFATDPYIDFLKGKMCLARPAGFPCSLDEINPLLFGHQKAIVKWCVEGGRRAIFSAYGLGKTWIQIEIARILLVKIQEAEGRAGRALIVLPLGVRREFILAAQILGVDVHFVRRTEDVTGPGIYLTNYESVRDGRLDPSLFDVASLDEADVLRSYGSKTYQEFLTLFDTVRFRFVATATPSPNRKKELIHYAGFLGIMDTGQALTRFFQRDSTQANNLLLYPHKETEFYLWLHSWTIFLQLPSDLGFSDDGYLLPPLDIRWHEIPSRRVFGDTDRDGQMTLLADTSVGLALAAREKNESIGDRLDLVAEILDEADPDEHFLLWHTLEAERHAIEERLPRFTTVYGTQDLEERERIVGGFADGSVHDLATKPILNGAGSNFQRYCRRAIVMGVDYKAKDFMQLLHRIYRFGQTREVRIDVIYTEAERAIVQELQRKIGEHNDLAAIMTAIIREHGLNTLSTMETLARSIGVERLEVSGERYTLANNDAVLEARRVEENSVGLIVTSWPFGNHYEYTDKYEDFGHVDDNDQFFEQMDFLTPEMFRILQPGRLYCVHVKDRILFGAVTGQGVPTVSPFHAEGIFHCRKHGFQYLGMITVVTDVVRENNQTYRLGWSENAKDSTKMGVGSPEYVLLFRKPQTDRTKAYADIPVTKEKPSTYGPNGEYLPWHEKRQPVPGTGYSLARWQVDAHAFWRSSGNRQLTAEEMAQYKPDQLVKMFTDFSLGNIYDYQFHVRVGEQIASMVGVTLPTTFMSLAPGSHRPDVWHDVNRMLTLNGEQVKRIVEQHICPLQFDIVDRLITRYSNPDDLVYDPYGGLGTVPLRAIKLGRRGRSSELKTEYFLDSAYYLRREEDRLRMPTLFDLEEIGTAEQAEAKAA